MKQFVVEYLITETAKSDYVRRCVAVDDADLRIDLKNGKAVAVYIINRALRLPEIRERYEENSMRKLNTLFIVDQRILPANKSEAEAAFWMSALHALTDGRIYAYRCERRDVSIVPLHIEWRWGAERRFFEYGPAVSPASLQTSNVDCASKYITGVFASATFGDAPFWKKRTLTDEKKRKHTWRNQSFHSNRRSPPPPPHDDEPVWDSWEEFERRYAEADFGNFNWSGNSQRQSSTGVRNAMPAAKHYSLLGVNTSASFDEVKRAYRTMARQYHPDLHPQSKQEYTQKMAEINAAFEAICKHLQQG
jgi:DnaJ domain